MPRHGEILSQTDIEAKIQQQTPLNTKNHGNWSFKAFNDWRNRIERNITNENCLQVLKEPSEMCKGDLNYLLQFFIHEVRKINGDKYHRDSLKQLYDGIQYYFRNVLKKLYGMFTDSKFSEARKSLDAAMKEATKEYRGLRKRKAGVISVEDKEHVDIQFLNSYCQKTVRLFKLIFSFQVKYNGKCSMSQK